VIEIITPVEGEDITLQIFTPSATNPQWRVWLNPDEEIHGGFCIGIGASRELAMADAVTTLQTILSVMEYRKAVPA
jgi:hypothetical protein